MWKSLCGSLKIWLTCYAVVIAKIALVEFIVKYILYLFPFVNHLKVFLYTFLGPADHDSEYIPIDDVDDDDDEGLPKVDDVETETSNLWNVNMLNY